MKLFQPCIAIGMLVFIGSSAIIAAPSTTPVSGTEKVTPLMKQPLPEAPGHNALMVTVEFLPGQSAMPHRHPGSVFAYVLEGDIISQLEGQKSVTYHQGQYWYEPPYVGHLICKNASDSRPAKLVVWQLVDEHSPNTLPYHKKFK